MLTATPVTPLSLADRLLGPTPHAGIDRLRTLRSIGAQAIAIVTFALLTGLAAQFQFKPDGWSVPITLQTLVIYSAGLYLGGRNGALAGLLYVLLGLLLPFYAGGESGPQHLLGATGGYLIGCILAPAVAGVCSRRLNGPVGAYLSLLASSVTLFSCGVTVLWLVTDLTLSRAIVAGWLVFVPIDLLKLLVVAGVYTAARKATTDNPDSSTATDGN